MVNLPWMCAQIVLTNTFDSTHLNLEKHELEMIVIDNNPVGPGPTLRQFALGHPDYLGV